MKTAAALANTAFLAVGFPAWRRFCTALKSPAATQRDILRHLLATNGASDYGCKQGFEGIRCYEHFRDRVPLVTYEEIEPDVARIMRGERHVLTCEPVTRLLPTSGTTRGSKLVPFTVGLQREFNRAIGPWMVDLCRTVPAMALGPSYWSISPVMDVPAPVSAVPVGFDDDSAYLGGVRQRLVEASFAVPSLLRTVKNPEMFRYLTLLCLLRQPELSFASVWHPSFLTLLFDALGGWWEELLEDVKTGHCPRAGSEVFKVRQVMSSAPQEVRAAFLRKMCPADISRIWPRLGLVSCWGDAQAALPLRDLRKRLPRAVLQGKGLLATEAFVSIPFRGKHPLAVRSHFYEFLAEGSSDPLLAGDLREGTVYEVIVTTGGGLWRYRLGDLIEVDGFVEATPSLRFVGRGAAVSDLCGEKLAEAFVTRAIRAACERAGFSSPFAMLAPDDDLLPMPRYLLFVEGEPPAKLAGHVDRELRNNPHYALCRDLGQLSAVDCVSVRHAAYEIYCGVLGAEGRRLGDIKPQSLSTRTDWRYHFAPRIQGG